MKKYFKIFKTLFALTLFFGLQTVSFSQPPPPAAHAQSGDQGPAGGGDGGAPIGEGMYILIGLAGLYAGKKIYDHRKLVQSKDLETS